MKTLIIIVLFFLFSTFLQAENYIQIAASYEKQGDYTSAISNYINAINNDIGNYKLYNRVALLYEKIGQDKLAKDYFVKAIIVNNDYVEGYYNLGLWYYKKAKYIEAMINFKRALSITYENIDLYVALINCYIKLNKIQLAERLLNKILNRFPENYKILNLAGIISLLRNDYRNAEKYFRRALEINNDDRLINNLGIALYLSGKRKEAKKLLTKIKKYDKIEENIKLIEGGGK